MQTIAIFNQKGGVGKTLTTIHLTAALARLEPDSTICLVDLDPQGTATEGVGLKDLYDAEITTLFDGLTKPNVSAVELLHDVPGETFFLMPGHIQMMLAEQELARLRRREYRLADLLAGLSDTFQWVIIDCPPNLGLLSDNAIVAAQKLVVPVQAEHTSVRALELLFDQIESLRQELKITVDILAVVPNLVQDSRLARGVLSAMRENMPVAPFEFPKRVVLQEAYASGRSIFAFEPDRSKREDAAALRDLYTRLAELVRKQVKHG